ncbi:uncharacterized protein C1orf115-like [Gouania willdenowi]|uniref:uncharacterized protein C1orf115-like n=1 Tax=Gouania willdenowi TaxID=441366 RepID=UPI0010545D10|nr:uncharacterized protein C1orf115-like [Gouania willdenowi]
MGTQQQQQQQQQQEKKRPSKTSKEVYFSVLPDRYEPLLEEHEEHEEEEHRRKRKRRFKKYRKNMLKALRFVSSCMMLGLRYAAASYASPAAVVTVVTQVQRGRGSSRA